ncbi:MAG: ribonuclease Z, partial [Nitrospirales bacterium]|nr:ribonuclease Z [Nitrospirales bacterium]
MKPSFHASLVNGPFEDPVVFVRVVREGRAFLFDFGQIGRLDPGDILKVSDIFVSHTHMDHFIGFDHFLRNALRRETPVRIYGPEGIISCVEGKLRGYTWNLIRDYPIKIEVSEIGGDRLSRASFHADQEFRRADHPPLPFDGLLVTESGFEVRACLLTHDIPVAAYALKETFHININKALLFERGLPVGPWLSDLKKEIRRQKTEDRGQKTEDGRQKRDEEMSFEVEGRVLRVEELMDIVTITRGQKISYVTDVSPTEENIEKVTSFVGDSDILFCEAYFLEKDRDRAVARHHLTAAITGRIAQEAGVRQLSLMHFSPKYRDCSQEIWD